MKIKTVTAILVAIMLTSCKTSQNRVSYFQDLGYNVSADSIANYEIKICPDDQLSIYVSSVDPNAVTAFNSQNPDQLYLVDSKGCIDFPVIGKLIVAGKTRNELVEIFKDKISAYAKSPIVSIQIANFKVSVLGEVNSPGVQMVTNERVSILDAIGMAGDLTLYGERSNVVLIRDNNGKKEYHRFDLTSSDMLSSPYFYLKQNDIIYVEPNKARRGNAKYSQNAQFNISVASTVVSAISVLASLTIALLVK